jgi:predicted enzyme related to lactoylglutathione lyase
MPTKYVHINIICKNCTKLADFYVQAFECEPSGKEYELYGDWLKKGASIESAKLKGINLKLPGYGKNGPILEIFQYDEMLEKAEPTAANREGFGHIAFHVDDLEATLEKMVSNGGNKLGEIVHKEFKSGTLHFTYATDPEGNVIELQKWEPK